MLSLASHPAPSCHPEMRVPCLRFVLRRHRRAVAEPLGNYVGGPCFAPVGGAAGAHVVVASSGPMKWRTPRGSSLCEMQAGRQPSMGKFFISKDTVQRVDAEIRRQGSVMCRNEARHSVPVRSQSSSELLCWRLGAAVGGSLLCGFIVWTLLGFPVTGARFVPVVAMAFFAGAFIWVVMADSARLRQSMCDQSRPMASEQAPTPPTKPLATAPEIARVRRYREALEAWRKSSWEHWKEMEGGEFETEFCALLNRHGWSVKATALSGDGGVDIVGLDEQGRKVVIQCKWWEKACGVEPVRELAGVIAVRYCDSRGLIVCKGGFTREAKNFAGQAEIVYWDSAEVRRLLGCGAL